MKRQQQNRTLITEQQTTNPENSLKRFFENGHRKMSNQNSKQEQTFGDAEAEQPKNGNCKRSDSGRQQKNLSEDAEAEDQKVKKVVDNITAMW